MNPILSMIFVQSFRQGFKAILEILVCWRKFFTPGSNLETSQSEEITLQDMRIFSSGIGQNISFNEN